MSAAYADGEPRLGPRKFICCLFSRGLDWIVGEKGRPDSGFAGSKSLAYFVGMRSGGGRASTSSGKQAIIGSAGSLSD